MTQVYYRANITDSQFPLVSTFQGKTVIQPQIDQNYFAPSLFGKEDRDKGIPEALYMHNVLPSFYGYKSVDYDQIIAGHNAITNVDRIFPVKDFAGNRGHVLVSESKTYIITNDSLNWVEITPPGQPYGAVASVADVTGSSFICYKNFGIFFIDLENKLLTTAAIQWDSPLTNASMEGIASSNNYLIAFTASTLYWSSALDVLDFRSSQITGAGSGSPTAAVGAIVTVASVNVGFAVYCQGNIVVATFSGNVQYPWLFKEAPNSAGIESPYHVSIRGDEGANYAWSSAGLIKVTLAGCSPVNPEVTDFLTGRLLEDYDDNTGQLVLTKTTKPFIVRVTYAAARYLCVSYGVDSLTHVLVLDTALNRWGKLRIPHGQIFDLSFSIPLVTFSTYTDFGDLDYLELDDLVYDDMSQAAFVKPAEARHGLAFVANNGAINVANLEYPNKTADAVLILGKYQIFRANTLSVQELTIETIDSDNSNFDLRLLTSLDGKNFDLVTVPHEIVSNDMRQYYCLATGQNHSLEIRGSFHIVGVVLVFAKNGNR